MLSISPTPAYCFHHKSCSEQLRDPRFQSMVIYQGKYQALGTPDEIARDFSRYDIVVLTHVLTCVPKGARPSESKVREWENGGLCIDQWYNHLVELAIKIKQLNPELKLYGYVSATADCPIPYEDLQGKPASWLPKGGVQHDFIAWVDAWQQLEKIHKVKIDGIFVDLFASQYINEVVQNGILNFLRHIKKDKILNIVYPADYNAKFAMASPDFLPEDSLFIEGGFLREGQWHNCLETQNLIRSIKQCGRVIVLAQESSDLPNFKKIQQVKDLCGEVLGAQDALSYAHAGLGTKSCHQRTCTHLLCDQPLFSNMFQAHVTGTLTARSIYAPRTIDEFAQMHGLSFDSLRDLGIEPNFNKIRRIEFIKEGLPIRTVLTYQKYVIKDLTLCETMPNPIGTLGISDIILRIKNIHHFKKDRLPLPATLLPKKVLPGCNFISGSDDAYLFFTSVQDKTEKKSRKSRAVIVATGDLATRKFGPDADHCSVVPNFFLTQQGWQDGNSMTLEMLDQWKKWKRNFRQGPPSVSITDSFGRTSMMCSSIATAQRIFEQTTEGVFPSNECLVKYAGKDHAVGVYTQSGSVSPEQFQKLSILRELMAAELDQAVPMLQYRNCIDKHPANELFPLNA